MRHALLFLTTLAVLTGATAASAQSISRSPTNSTVLAPAAGGCDILVQFFNGGTPMMPGISPDRRYGVRLNVEGTVSAVLPADDNGFVRIYGTLDHPVPFTVVRLYMADSYAQATLVAGDHLAYCGMQSVQVPAGA